MKTVKEVSQLTGISVRTLRYYDEIGLLKPSKLTDAGYRLYDKKALGKLQEIMFFKELEVPLNEIKEIFENSNYDRQKVLQIQKTLLERKRNRLNGLIELITDAMEGANMMSFEAFTDDEIKMILDHTLLCMSKKGLAEQIEQFGSEEKYRAYLTKGFSNEQAVVDLMKWYGSKEKVIEAILQAPVQVEERTECQDQDEKIYRQFMVAKAENNAELANEMVELLAENYKKLFCLDNARNILLDLAKEYLEQDKLAKVTDEKYGMGCAEYVGKAIQFYYGI